MKKMLLFIIAVTFSYSSYGQEFKALDKSPLDMIRSYCENNLNDNGVFIMGIDHYKENSSSLSWPTDLDVYMNTKSIEEWTNILKLEGLKEINYEQFNSSEKWGGTLIISGIK